MEYSQTKCCSSMQVSLGFRLRYSLIQSSAISAWECPALRGEVPSPRASHAATVWKSDRLVVHGGVTAEGQNQDLWVLDYCMLSHS